MSELKLIYQNDRVDIFRDISLLGDLKIVKVLRDLHPNQYESAKFQHEFKSLQEIDNDNLIKVTKLGEHEGRLAIWFEDINGQSLENFDLPLSLENFFQVAIAVTEALGATHAAGLVHKDIKPANIIAKEDFSLVQIIDFGKATKIHKEQQGIKVEEIEGTWAYMAPEQTGRIPGLLDYRADYYSLGLTFYELLTGKKAFTGSDCLDWFSEHMS